MTEYGWKFVAIANDGTITSRYGDHQWIIGEWAPAIKRLKLCKSGYHHSPDPLSALYYIPTNGLARTEARGVVAREAGDFPKSVHEEMRIIEIRRWTKRDSVALTENVNAAYIAAYDANAAANAAYAAAYAAYAASIATSDYVAVLVTLRTWMMNRYEELEIVATMEEGS